MSDNLDLFESRLSKAEMMRRLRKSRKESGMVNYQVWVTPKEKAQLEKLYKSIVKSRQ